MKIVVLGAGPAGLIASLMIQRAFPKAEITLIDKKPVDKFSEPEVKHPFFIHEDIGPLLGVPLKKVRISESVLSDKSPAEWANYYSWNTIGLLTPNVIWEFDKPFRVREAFMADRLTHGLFEQLNPNRVNAVGGISLEGIDLGLKMVQYCEVGVVRPNTYHVPYDYLINTIPLPMFLKLSGLIDKRPFPKMANSPMLIFTWDQRNNPFYNKVAQIFFNPESNRGFTRFGNIFGQVTWEAPCSADPDSFDLHQYPINFPCGYHGLATIQPEKHTPPLRFIPADERAIDTEIFRLTREHDILQLGRYATWRYRRVDHLPGDMTKIVDHIFKES